MKDSYGRTIDYMRISITDRCNLRCKYCMPHGVKSLSRREILTLEEIGAIAICAAGLGIRHIKITGGEPLVRRDCCRLVAYLKSIPGIEKVTITTNGVLLDQYLEPLLTAGIDGINISLDTLDPSLYQQITGFDCLEQVMGQIRRAAALPIPVKINAVSSDFEAAKADGPGGQQWRRLAELTLCYPLDVRFIEMMPIGYGKQYQTINHRELLKRLRGAYPGLAEDHTRHGCGPAVYYKIPGALGSVGLISAIHGKFCAGCNRVRLTSQGFLKACLCYEDGADLRAILREGAMAQEGEERYLWPFKECPGEAGLQTRLAAAMRKAIESKPASHCFERPGEVTESNNMIAIGG